MPPVPLWFRGTEHYGAFMRRVFELRGTDWALTRLAANGQPALAAYASAPRRDRWLHSLQVFTVAGGRITRNVVFADPQVLDTFDLPRRISSN
jgi:RNA polymerase sigma-70 factor (ECF subfamily)